MQAFMYKLFGGWQGGMLIKNWKGYKPTGEGGVLLANKFMANVVFIRKMNNYAGSVCYEIHVYIIRESIFCFPFYYRATECWRAGIIVPQKAAGIKDA